MINLSKIIVFNFSSVTYDDETSLMRISKLPNTLLAFTYAKNSLSCVTWACVRVIWGVFTDRDSAAAPTLWFLRLVVGPEHLRRWRTSSPRWPDAPQLWEALRQGGFIYWRSPRMEISHLQNRPGTKRVLLKTLRLILQPQDGLSGLSPASAVLWFLLVMGASIWINRFQKLIPPRNFHPKQSKIFHFNTLTELVVFCSISCSQDLIVCIPWCHLTCFSVPVFL